ncbi:hypothetical protein BHE74_00021286 [Ensete ventricosum]|nr:hypothetical protein BHE74_00021286 [Ensete ventricosum]
MWEYGKGQLGGRCLPLLLRDSLRGSPCSEGFHHPLDVLLRCCYGSEERRGEEREERKGGGGGRRNERERIEVEPTRPDEPSKRRKERKHGKKIRWRDPPRSSPHVLLPSHPLLSNSTPLLLPPPKRSNHCVLEYTPFSSPSTFSLLASPSSQVSLTPFTCTGLSNMIAAIFASAPAPLSLHRDPTDHPSLLSKNSLAFPFRSRTTEDLDWVCGVVLSVKDVGLTALSAGQIGRYAEGKKTKMRNVTGIIIDGCSNKHLEGSTVSCLATVGLFQWSKV